MLILTKYNLLSYLKDKYPQFDQRLPVEIRAIGEQEEDPAGLINFIFQVRNANASIIVKQGQENIRSAQGFQYLLPPSRNHLEAISLRLRKAIVPQYVPELYLLDLENNVFIMEDVSYLRPCRQALVQGEQFPGLGSRCGEFMAATAFYTSEFYLPRTTFRSLAQCFTNSGMRRVMEEWVFLHRSPFPPFPETMPLRAGLEDPEVLAQTYQLRHRYMSSQEALIHSDLHTGNIFIKGQQMKVIDMEYTFAGPCAYDLGYFLGSILSLYCASLFRTMPGGGAAYRRYLLEVLAELFIQYRRTFTELWSRDAKPDYRSCMSYCNAFLDDLLPDAVGYGALAALTLSLSGPDVLDFQAIEDKEKRLQAIQLYYAMARSLLLLRTSLKSVSDFLNMVVTCSNRYMKRKRPE